MCGRSYGLDFVFEEVAFVLFSFLFFRDAIFPFSSIYGSDLSLDVYIVDITHGCKDRIYLRT